MSFIRLHAFGYNFTPKLIPTIVTLLLLPTLFSLGKWQLHRAEEKRLLQSSFEHRKQALPLTNDMLPTHPADNLLYYPVYLKGNFDNQHSFLLDNRFYQHQVGYEVISPFILPNKTLVLVNRGWIPNDQNSLSKISASLDTQTIKGMIYFPSKKPFLLGEAIGKETAWPQLIQAIELSKIGKKLNQPLYPFVVLLSPENKGGFKRDWKPVVISPYRHIGYAIQWFGLALTLLIIFIAVNIHKAPSIDN